MSTLLLFLAMSGGVLVPVLSVVVAITVLVPVLRDRTSPPAPHESAAGAGIRRHAALTAASGWAAASLAFGAAFTAGGAASLDEVLAVLGFLAPSAAVLVLLVVQVVGELTWPRAPGPLDRAPGDAARTAPRAVRLLMWLWVSLLAVAVLAFGAVSDDGRTVSVTTVQPNGAPMTYGVGPFPGWAYGPALLTGSVLVVLLAECTLQLVTRRRAVTGAAGDRALRVASARRAVHSAHLSVAVTLAGVLLYAGNAIGEVRDARAGALVTGLAAVVAVVAVAAAAASVTRRSRRPLAARTAA
ncbi:hypothetical protein [Georgenia wangjunii]|uniref:hypothetical protein n=1 Tax=Georgenia wangjunii TaxID=3117730 RepID=UPI002F26A815